MKFDYIKYHTEFNDPYAFAAQIKQGTIEHHQLMPGSFHGELTQIVSDPVIISTHQMNLSLLQSGTGISGYTAFLVPGYEIEDFGWRKDRISGERIGIIKSGGLHFTITPPNFFGTPISISNKYFNELIIENGYDANIYKLIQQTEAIDLYREDAFEIQQLLISICKSNKPDYNLLTIELPKLLLKAIEKIQGDKLKQIHIPRYKLFGEVLGYIHQHLDQKIGTLDICLAINISERNLRYVFKEMIGLSPMKYIKTIRLNRVKKEITNSTGEIDISATANKWGFNHSGQFAADYKKLFGESPSQTVKA